MPVDKDDELDKLLLEARTDEYGDSGNYNEAKLKQFIQAHTDAKVKEAEERGTKYVVDYIRYALPVRKGKRVYTIDHGDMDKMLAHFTPRKSELQSQLKENKEEE